MSKQVTIAGKQVEVSVKRNERAKKTVKVEIKSKDKIVVSLPEGVDIDVDAFLEKHKNLLEKNTPNSLKRNKFSEMIRYSIREGIAG